MATRPGSDEPATWRLLHSGWNDGPTNMAVDEAILESVAAGLSPPTLRFYGWKPACLSLGHAQPASTVDWDACAARGWDVVRRPTGGRAILHVDELTYSVCAPETEARVAGGVLESYQRLSQALAQGLTLLGLAPRRSAAAAGRGRGAKGPVCFDMPSRYEITVGPRKLVGSAQARKKGAVLQHGTLPLHGDIARILFALRPEPAGREEMARRLHASALTLESALGRRVPFAEAAACLEEGFRRALSLSFNRGALSAHEEERARAIRAQKYAAESWTRRL